MSGAPAPVVILISGRGSNLQAILDETRAGRLPIEIRAVISNNPEAGGLQRARSAGVPTEIASAFISMAMPGAAGIRSRTNAAAACTRPYSSLIAGTPRSSPS